MKRYEHQVIHAGWNGVRAVNDQVQKAVGRRDGMELYQPTHEYLNVRGAEGWEVVGVVGQVGGYVVFLKRELS